MAKSVQLPDGSWFPLKDGEDPSEALAAAQKLYPEAFSTRTEEKPKQDTTGLKAAASAGFTRLGGEFELLKGKTGIKSEAEAQKEYEAAQAKAAARFTPTEKGWTEDPFLKFKETLGGSLPYTALPVMAGLAALTAPVSAPVAAGLGLLGAGAVSAGQFTGSNLARQMDTGKSLEEASLGKAVAAAVPQALVDTAAMALLPGVGKLFSSVGSKLTTEQAKAIASQTLGRTIADYTAKTGMAMGREGFTEVVQQSLERLQAGLNITDPEARKEYVESFIGGAVLGGVLAPAGRYMERSGARRQAEEADTQDKAAAKAAAAQTKAAADAAEEARKQTPEYMRAAVADSAALEKQKRDLQAQIIRAPKGETLTEEQKQANVVINAQLKELAPKLTEAAKESNRVKPLLAKAAEEARLAGMSPEDYMLEQTFRSPGMQLPRGGRFETVSEEEPVAPPEPTAVQQYAAQQTEAAQEAGALTLSDITEYLMRDPVMATEIVRTRTAIPGLPKQTNDAVIGALALQLKAAEKQNTQLGAAARRAAQQRLSTVEAEEQAALAESRRQQAILDADVAREQKTAPARMQQMLLGQKPGENLLAAMQTQPGVIAARAAQAQREQAEAQSRAEAAAAAATEAARLKKVTPEVEALQRIAGRPAVGVANLINRLPIETPAQATTRAGSSVMGRTAQDLQGLPIGADGQPIYTAEEEKAPETKPERAPATRVKGDFRLFNQRGEPARASDTKSIQERLARVLAEADLDQDAYDFLRRAEDIAPTASPEVLSLLDRQLTLIEQGQEGIVGPEVKGERPARYQGFPVQGTRAEAAAPTMADLRDIRNNASADPKTLTELQRKRVEAYNRYIKEGKNPAQAAGYAYRDVVAQPEGERVATATGEVPRTKRGKADTGRTLTLGSAKPATPLSLRGELEPLLRQAEKAAAPKRAPKGQRQLQLFRSPRVKKEAAKAAPVEKTLSEGEARRQQASTEREKAEQARTDARKEEQRRLEQRFADNVNSQVIPALSEAERLAREMGEPRFSNNERTSIAKDPVQVLGGYRSRVTALEKKVQAAQERSKAARLKALDALKNKIEALEAQYKVTKSSEGRAALIPQIDAATDRYAAAASRLNSQPLTWKGMAAQIKELSVLYNKVGALEDIVGEEVKPSSAEKTRFTGLLSKQRRETIAKAEAEKKREQEAAEAREAGKRAGAPATTGEALTRTQVAKARKAKKTVFGTATGSAAEATAAKATAIQARAVAERTVIEARAKLAKGEELTDLEKSILAQADAKAKAEEATAEEATAEEATVEEEVTAEAEPITVVEQRKAKDDVGNAVTEVEFSDGSSVQLIRLNSIEGFGLAGWHDANVPGAGRGYLGDTKADAIQTLVKRKTEEATAEEVNTEPTIEMVVGPEAATVVKAEVAKLAPAEVTALEETYGAKKNSKKFLAQLSADIVDMVNNGGRAVAKGIKAIVNKLASGVLATAMIFNPQFSATHLSFDLPQTYKQTITQQVDIRAEVPAEAREQMSPLAQMVYENMAPAAKASGKGFGIVDKPNGVQHYFKADGSLIVQGPSLTGKDIGDLERGNSLTGGAKITPAGKFTLAYTRDSSYTGGYRFDLAETFRPGEGVIAIHAVYVGDPKENRLGRLLSPTGTDNRISYGCINTTNEMFVNKLMPNSSELNGGMLLVLPDATEKTAEMFPKQVQTVTKTFAGVEKTAKTGTSTRLLPGKEEKLSVDSLNSLYRTSKGTGTALKLQTIRGLVDRVVGNFANAPEIEVIENESQLPDYIRAQAKADKVEGSIPGVFDPNSNKVYLVASNLFDPADVFTTIAHEVTGHFGLRSLLGAGYAAEMNRIYNGNRDVKAKADAKMRETPSLNQNTATEEVLADMAERDPNAKGPGVLRAVYDALRSFIRRVFGQSVSDKQVQQLVANARRHVIQGGVNRVAETGKAAPLYRVAKPKYESENALTDLADRLIAQPKSFKERMGSNLALEAEMNAVDMRAAVQEVLKRGAKEMGDDSLFTQAIYNVRKADQYMPQVQASLTTGSLETYIDEKGFRGIRSSNKDSAVDVISSAKKVPAKNASGKFSLATTYMVAQRAANKGLTKLDLGELGVTQAELDAAMAAVEADPVLKDALEEVRRKYNAYNEGQIKFLAEMGAIPKATAKEWLKEGDYVPYYRVRDDGTAELVLGGERTITVGNIRTQPYLAELKGGETKILPLNESIIRNTMLITKAALYNGGTKEFAYAMQEFGKGKGEVDPKTGKAKDAMPIHKGQGPDGTNIIRFNQEPDPSDPKDDGKRWQRIVTKGTAMEGIPAELVVKSLEGAHLTLPAFLKIGGIAGDWLRKGVTRMPPYIFRQLIRDPMAASFTGGLNYGPFRAVVMAGTEFLRSSAGRSEGYKKLIEKGLVQSGVFTGDPDDMSAFALQLASGKDAPAIDRFLGMLDRAAIRADAATRLLVHDNAVKNGLSEVEADLMTMESMNFYKRGLSPTVQYANRLYPFLNAQIQGLNVLAKAMRGNMPFNERQRIQRKFWNNAVMLFGVGLVYAMAMEDDETFKNAKPRDKYTNFFVHLPGVSEPVKIPLPYESGWFFTAAVALADAMKAETNSKQQLKALRDIFLSSIPGYSSVVPQAVKPLFEVWTNKNFFSGQNIESVSMQNRSPEERFNASTTEAAKMLAKVLPLSPVQVEHIARGYFGTAPLALMSVASGFMREETKGEAPARRLSETPILGTVFQKQYGGADADTMYAFAKEATQRAASLKDIQKNGTPQDAKEYLANHRTEIMLAPMARNFEMLLGRLRTQEDVVRNRKDLNAEEKRARLDQLDKVRQDLANKFNAAVRKVEERQAS